MTRKGNQNNCSDSYSDHGRDRHLDWLLDFDNVKDKIVYSLINKEANAELLEDRPYIDFLDLAIVFKCIFAQDDEGYLQMPVHNVHMRLWCIKIEELSDVATMNTPKLREYEITSMHEVLQDLIQRKQIEDNGSWDSDIPVYVLTNKAKIDGAACLLYPQLLTEFAERKQSNFYVIPSSIHEVLLLPAEDSTDAGMIRGMIKEVNDTQVDVTERLSYSLYYFDRAEGKLKVV